jgi:ferredoxin
MVLSKNPTNAPSWYSEQLPFSGNATLGLRNITKPTLVCTEDAMDLFYIGDNARVFRTSMEMDGFLSNFGTSSMEIGAIDLDLGEDIIRSMQTCPL